MNALKHQLKVGLGAAAAVAFPGLAREVAEGRRNQNGALMKRLMTYSRVHRAARARDTARVETALQQFWAGSDGDRFHSSYRDARYRQFLEHHAEICEHMREMIDAAPGQYTRVVEVGCGDGHVLCYAAGRLDRISEFVGIDLNARAIEDARQGVECPRTRFVVGDALAWLEDEPKSGTVVVTAGGVLEYFSVDRVQALFGGLAANGPAALALIEPLDPDHDIARDTASRIFGRENSFSHAYPALLSQAGFETLWSREIREGGIRWLLILAERGPSGEATVTTPRDEAHE